jgi:hypothetical protein
MRKEKATIGNNPFNDWFFWLSLATTDFGLFENEKQADCESDKQPLLPKKEIEKQ